MLALWACLATTLGAEAPRPIVAMTFVGPEDDRGAFTASLSELLMRLDVDLAIRQTDAPLPKDALLAIVTADWSDALAVTVNIQDADGHVVLVRRLARGNSPSVVIEAATHIVQSVIEELAHPTAPRLSAPPVLSAAVVLPKPLEPERRETNGLALSLAGFAGARLFGVGPPQGASVAPGGGLRLEVTWAGGSWRPSAFLLVQGQAPFEIKAPEFDLSIQTVPFRLGLGLAAFGGDSWRFNVGLGAGGDVFITTPSSRSLPDNRVKPQRVDVSAIITGHAAIHFALGRSTDLFLAFNLDVDPSRPRWVAGQGGGPPVTVFNPWPVRPGLLLGFSFTPVGPEPYAAGIGALR